MRSAVARRLDSGRVRRAVLSVAVLVAYILAFLVLFPRLMTIVSILAVIPVAAIAWSGGLRAGVVAGVLALTVNTLLMTLSGASGWDGLIRTPGGIVGSGALVFVGIAIGWPQQIRARLRASEERYALIANASSDGIWEFDPRSNQVTYRSPHMKEFLGFKPTDDLGPKQSLHFVHPDDAGMVLTARDDYLAKRNPRYEVEYRVKAAGGEWRWVRSQGEAVWDESGRAVRLAGVTIDITQEREAEAALRESEARYALVVNSTTEGLWEFDPLSNQMTYRSASYGGVSGYQANRRRPRQGAVGLRASRRPGDGPAGAG